MKRGFSGLGVYHPKTGQNVGTLWRSAHAFGADFLFTVGRRYGRQASDTMNTPCHVPLYHHLFLGSLLANLPVGCRLVGVEIAEGAKDLSSYIHPLQACYLLGAEDHGLPKDVLSRCHEVVQIPGASHCLNVAVAGSILLYDRSTKTPSKRPV